MVCVKAGSSRGRPDNMGVKVGPSRGSMVSAAMITPGKGVSKVAVEVEESSMGRAKAPWAAARASVSAVVYISGLFWECSGIKGVR